MRKFLIWLSVVSLMLGSIAMAENAPGPDFGTKNGTEKQDTAKPDTAGSDDTQTAAVSLSVPSGQRTFKYTMLENGPVGFMMREWEFADSVQAEEPDEFSTKYTALPGTKLLHIQCVYRFRGDRMPLDQVQVAVADGTLESYPVTVFLEGCVNTISTNSVRHGTVDCKTDPNKFLLPLAGSTKQISGYGNADSFILCDLIAEIPEDLAETDMPFYLIVKVGETEYYIYLER